MKEFYMCENCEELTEFFDNISMCETCGKEICLACGHDEDGKNICNQCWIDNIEVAQDEVGK